jgi:putative aldouronate transport system substrate-binding protein
MLKRKLVAILLTAAVILSFASSGCSNTAKTDNSPSGTDQKPTEQKAADTQKKNETLEISILAPIWAPYEQDKTIVPDIEKATNTKLNIEWSPQDNFKDKVSTVLASGKLPDVIIGADKTFLKKQGAIIPLDDLMKTNAPNFLSKLKAEDNPYLKDFEDGHIYNFSIVIDFPPIHSTMIRKDWLDRVGMKVPEKWDDWMAVWRAFKAKDANGDGNPNNEIPYSGGVNKLKAVFGMKTEGTFVLDDKGNYTVVQEHPRYKEFLEACALMYKEGLLDKEYITRGVMGDLFTIMDNNTCGSVINTAERARLSTEVLRGKDPKATWLCVKPIIGPRGDQGILGRAKFGGANTFVTIAPNKDKAAKIVQFIDYFYSNEGTKLRNYGVEGTHHDTVAGKPVLRAPYINGFVEARKAGLIFQPLPFNWTKENYMQILTSGKSYEQLTETQKIFYDGLFINEGFFFMTPPTLATAAYNEKSTDVIAKLNELEAGIISGNIPLGEFDKRMADIKKAGLDQIIKQGNEAWQKIK